MVLLCATMGMVQCMRNVFSNWLGRDDEVYCNAMCKRDACEKSRVDERIVVELEGK